MSEDKRRIVEQAIAELQLDSSSGPGAAADDGLGGEGAEGVPAAVLEKVEGMGFSVVDVAALAARPGIRKVSQALDWLVLNVPEERLPTRFTGKKGGAEAPWCYVLLRGAPAWRALGWLGRRNLRGMGEQEPVNPLRGEEAGTEYSHLSLMCSLLSRA